MSARSRANPWWLEAGPVEHFAPNWPEPAGGAIPAEYFEVVPLVPLIYGSYDAGTGDLAWPTVEVAAELATDPWRAPEVPR